ncbi:uncharacterized protein LTR77_004319 [Saxophila tyrrhenica]|uniref:Uncharacterized protein n=1 Tax=Saxophila tyrrhenica TaxID=1690608 RepID=A0AAV9PFL2_9PEZI|nr:hypothetical protein LTR77_004319 [Saxophila tyrrhenica]
MRYQDWDVLLFPSGDEAHIPVKEFRTACYTEPTEHSPNQTPLLTTFVPSLPVGAPFQISVHSWVRTGPTLGVLPDGTRLEEMWQVKVVVDGELVGIKLFGCAESWPQIISSIDSPGKGQHETVQLRFPPFHREIMMQNHWAASDRMGRIRVELGMGYVHHRLNRFVPTTQVVNFAFQAAPLELLEDRGVAWPNARMLANSVMHTHQTMNNAFFPGPQNITGTQSSNKYGLHQRKVASTSNINTGSYTMGALTLPRPGSPLHPFGHDQHSNYDGSSRSTSAYSAMPDTAAPLLHKGLYHPTPGYLNQYTEAAQRQRQSIPASSQFSFRLPSDQINRIITALGSKTQEEQPTNTSTSMLPPPIPQRVAAVNKDAEESNGDAAPGQFQLNQAAASDNNRRGRSNYSDISMHNDCTSFPTCTQEDGNSGVVHNPPVAPAETTSTAPAVTAPTAPTAKIVKGKKEGSASAKRKLSTSAQQSEATEKKRTRRSTRLLQHDSGYAGGLSSSDRDVSNGNGTAGAEPAVVESNGRAGQEADESGAAVTESE